MLEEIRQVVPSGPITGEHIDKLVTVQQVLTESLRLFPPLPVMSRYAAEDVELAGERIKAGTLIGLPIYVIHRHRNLWDDRSASPTPLNRQHSSPSETCRQRCRLC